MMKQAHQIPHHGFECQLRSPQAATYTSRSVAAYKEEPDGGELEGWLIMCTRSEVKQIEQAADVQRRYICLPSRGCGLRAGLRGDVLLPDVLFSRFPDE